MQAATGTMEMTMADMMANVTGYAMAAAGVLLLIWLFQAGLAASLARQKGYSGIAGFIIALILPGLGLIYQAGRPISQDMEDERQRTLAGRIAKAIRRSERSQEKGYHSEEDEAPVRRRFERKG